jgi:hypothetical protein
MGSIFLEKSILSPHAEIHRVSTGVFTLYDLLNGLHVMVSINSPAAPVTLYSTQEALTLPAKECGTGNIEATADIAGFIFFQIFSGDHGDPAGQSATIDHIKYSY